MYRTSNRHRWWHRGWESTCQCRQVQSLVGEDSKCCGATKPVCLNYWACALEPRNCSSWSPCIQSLSSATREMTMMRSPHTAAKRSPTCRNLRKLGQSNEGPVPPKTKNFLKRDKQSLYASFTDGQTFNASDKCELPRLRMRMTGTDRAVGIPGTLSE